MSKPSREVLTQIEAAFHAADNLIRSQPEEWQDELCDLVLRWAIRQYLPASTWFRGLYAYSIHPDDPAADVTVKIMHAEIDARAVQRAERGNR